VKGSCEHGIEHSKISVVTIHTTRFNILKLCILVTEHISVFCAALAVNSDYFRKQDWLIHIHSGELVSFLWGTNCMRIICIC
jgi:hypothetical protein